jgi:hypothetical protein
MDGQKGLNFSSEIACFVLEGCFMERTFFRVFLTILFEHCVKRGIKYSKGMIFRYSFCKIESLKHSEIDFNQINKNSELISPKEKFMFEN